MTIKTGLLMNILEMKRHAYEEVILMKRVWFVMCIAVCMAVGGCQGISQLALNPTIEPTPSQSNTVIPSPSSSHEVSPTVNAMKASMSPAAVVKLFFEYWAAKDISGMNNLRVRQYSEKQEDLSHLLNLQLLKCTEDKNLSVLQLNHFKQLGYEDAYDKAIVNVVFIAEGDDKAITPGKSTVR
jgi:hypothetical protein